MSSDEVAERMNRGENNRHAIRPTRTYSQIIWANVFGLYNLVLFASFAILLILEGPRNALATVFIVVVNILLGTVQEIRAKRALDKLAMLSTRTVSVRRDGKSVVIPIEDVVLEDVIELQPGYAVVVDGHVLASDSLEIDESLLTGESEYVPKQVGDKLLSGSFCVAGAGLMLAEEIGSQSYVNNLAMTARAYKNIRTPLERSLDAVFQVLIATMAILGPLTLLAGIVRGNSLAESVENVVNVIGSLVPIGLIVSVAISFAYGALNISRFQALIQRLNAIESIGHITCLCADKTGTLTRNILSVKTVVPVSEETLSAVQSKLASYVANISWKNRTIAAIASFVDGTQKYPSKVAEVPFNSNRKWSAVTLSTGETLLLGAPEILLANSDLHAETLRLSEQGLRVVAFATSPYALGSTGQSLPSKWKCIALIGLQDEIRSDIGETLEEFAKQGIGIKIISGDSAETVEAIAHQAGIRDSTLLSGLELDRMDEKLLDTAVQKTNLFARIVPETKRKIVASLTKRGGVAMIGDGVNDVPALKQASVAIAVNDGAQIAKDISDIILLNNAFSTLPRAIAEGREITQRIYAITKIFLVKVVYLNILFVLAGFIGLPFPLSLLQTTWLGTMTIGIPTLMIAFRMLPAANTKSSARDVIQYGLLGGIIGGLAMTLIDIVILVVLRGNLDLARTMIIVFACLYASVILLDVQEVSLFSPTSFLLNWRSAIAGLILGIYTVATPLYLIPAALELVSLARLHWLLLTVFLVAAYIALQYAVRRMSLSGAVSKLFCNPPVNG
ncbi:MAG: HAD-IC family P-type ATPase [Thaumarchaeota archaeon]|nr:HAD-IC family P-type ATPase [Nitrososphaerota archaeon]